MVGFPPARALLEVEPDRADDPERDWILDPVDLVRNEDHLVGLGDEDHDRVVRGSSLVGDERGDVEGERRRREVERETLEWSQKDLTTNKKVQCDQIRRFTAIWALFGRVLINQNWPKTALFVTKHHWAPKWAIFGG